MNGWHRRRGERRRGREHEAVGRGEELEPVRHDNCEYVYCIGREGRGRVVSGTRGEREWGGELEPEGR